jgi:hypothetical protein
VLEVLPRLELALLANELPWSKVRLVARVASAADEEAWIARARETTTRHLERVLRESAPGGEPDALGDSEASVRLALRCTPAVRAKWGLACEMAERVAGERLRAGEVLESVAAEVFSALSIATEVTAETGSAVACSGRVARLGGEAPEGCEGCAEFDPTSDVAAGAPDDGRAHPLAMPFVLASLAAGLEGVDAFELDRRLCRAVRLEQTLDAAVAPLLRRVTSAEYEWRGEYMTLAAYAREQLGMSPSKARALLRLERAGDACPGLREAYRSGRLSWVKAQCLLPLLLLDIPGEWRPAWVAWAQRVTVRRLEGDVERALLLRAGHHEAWQRCKENPERTRDPIPPGEQQMCAPDVDLEATQQLVWRVPPEVGWLFRAVQETLRARLDRERERPFSDGEVFDAMLDHALGAWTRRDQRARRADPVIERDGYRCVVPGCTSRRNLHDHHIAFRSAGGSDEPGNRITLCAFHHQRGVHAGLLRVHGRAPDALVFELGLHAGSPPLARYRSGDIAVPQAPVSPQRAA